MQCYAQGSRIIPRNKNAVLTERVLPITTTLQLHITVKTDFYYNVDCISELLYS